MTTPAARYEIAIDGKTRSHRDTKAAAIEAAEYLKLRNLACRVTVRDIESGEVIVISPSGQPEPKR
jgi:hypothetical protein